MIKMLSVLFVAITGGYSHAQDFLRTADVGFRNHDKYISIELVFSVDGDALKFRLSSTEKPEQTSLLSECTYTQKSLEAQVQTISDGRVRADFEWLFFRSGYSGSDLEHFYPELKSLLERAAPKCPVRSLPDLLTILNGMKS